MRRILAALLAALALLWYAPASADFPTVADTCIAVESSDQTTHDACLPTGIEADNLLIWLAVFDGTPTVTTPSGWTAITGSGNCPGTFSTTGRTNCYYRIATGTETTAPQITTSVGEESVHILYNIEGHDSLAAPPEAAGVGGSSAAPNPPNLAPAAGSKDYLWIEFAGSNEDDVTTPYESADYTAAEQSASSTNAGGVSGSSAYRTATAASEDPGAMTLGSTQPWRAVTLAIHPGLLGIDQSTTSIDNSATFALLDLEGGGRSGGGGGGGGPTGCDATVTTGSDIQATLDAATINSIICFSSGTYKVSASVNKPLTLKAATPGGAIIDGGTTATFTWTGSGSTWQATVGYDPGMIVIGDPGYVLFPSSSSVLDCGYSYSAGTVTARTCGLNPNSATLSVGDSSRTTCLTINSDNVIVEGFKFRNCRNKGVHIASGADNAVVRQNMFTGFGMGVNCGRSSVVFNPEIANNAFTNYPIYRYSVDGAVGSTGTVGSEEWQWIQLYNTSLPGFTGNGAGSTISEVSAISCGAGGAQIVENFTWDSFDCYQPRRTGIGVTQMVWLRNVAVNCRDDVIEADEFGGGFEARIAFGFNLNGKSNCLGATIEVGPGIFDHNICQRTADPWAVVTNDSLQKGWMFKHRTATQGEPQNNSSYVHNTIIGLNSGSPSDGLDCCGPGSGSNNQFANNLIYMPGETNLTMNSVFTTFASCTSTASTVFTQTSPTFDYDPGTTCINGGNTTWDLHHQSTDPTPNAGGTDGNPDRGAIEDGKPWPLLSANVGPGWWDPDTDFRDFDLHSSIDRNFLGLH